MSNHLKLLFYIIFVAAIFFFVQNKFNLFEVKFLDGEKQSSAEENETTGLTPFKPHIEVYNEDQNVVRINIEVADEEYERNLGLSGRNELGDYSGMLFIFNTEGGYTFWMKEMLIPLDIIFIDAQGFIVDIKEELEPCTVNYCPKILSNNPFKYALEVNSGFAKTNSVVVGNSVVLNLENN